MQVMLNFMRRRLLSVMSAAETVTETARKRLKYMAMKRGILENELILRRFLDSHFDRLNQEDLVMLDRLLNEHDWDILAWITGQRETPEPYNNSNLFHALRMSVARK